MIKNLHQLYAIYPDMEKQIMDKYPISKDEKRGCETEKSMRNAARLDYGKKLIEESKEKKEHNQIPKANG